MAISNKTYDALIIPTGETTFGDYSFPVTNKAIELFNSGKYGCLFITGGYSGFATAERKGKDSEGKETYDYILNKGIKGLDEKKVFYDDLSLESVGNFTFPIVEQAPGNPNLRDFDNMKIVAKAGHIWRLIDYTKLVMPDKFKNGKIDFSAVPGEHNNGLTARVYHKGVLNAIGERRGAEEIHDFLINKHPFYSDGWYKKSVNRRKLEMSAIGGLWNLGLKKE